MIMEGTKIKLGDSVFCTMRGPGTVTSIQGDKFVGVSFSGREFIYTASFAWTKSKNRSLYWHDPVVAPPPKNSDAWELMKRICMSMTQIFNEYGVE